MFTAYSLAAAPPHDLAMERALWTFRLDDTDASIVALFLTALWNATVVHDPP